MPWEASSVMDQKVGFVSAWLAGEAPVTVLCERWGISRQTGHLWLRRYRSEGPSGLEERSRAPLHHGGAMEPALALRLIGARRNKPYWGPKKLLAILREEEPDRAWPSASTVSALFKREGLSEPRRRRRRVEALERPFAEALEPNDTWCIDFKGWFRTRDGRRCDPLTVSDAFSRMLLGLRILDPVTEAVEQEMDRLFREHGLPRAIRSDNGPPFASSGAGGLTRLSARWAKLGLRLERIHPGCPQQNGRHERMHGTLKAQACKPPEGNLTDQQRRFDAFRREYNHERPHEALRQCQPARLYKPSPRPFPRRIPEPAYDKDELVRHVRSNGEIRWNGGKLFVSEALVGEVVGLRQREDGSWIARFADVPLIIIDHTGQKVTRLGPQRPPRFNHNPKSA